MLIGLGIEQRHDECKCAIEMRAGANGKVGDVDVVDEPLREMIGQWGAGGGPTGCLGIARTKRAQFGLQSQEPAPTVRPFKRSRCRPFEIRQLSRNCLRAQLPVQGRTNPIGDWQRRPQRQDAHKQPVHVHR